jgi:hypothetical protein
MLAEAMQEFLRSELTLTYLTYRQGMTSEQAASWVDMAIQTVQITCTMPSVVGVERSEQAFLQALSHIRRVPIFQPLSPKDAQALAASVFLRHHEKGHAFFYQHEPS